VDYLDIRKGTYCTVRYSSRAELVAGGRSRGWGLLCLVCDTSHDERVSGSFVNGWEYEWFP
jgi:hypothetical protein